MRQACLPDTVRYVRAGWEPYGFKTWFAELSQIAASVSGPSPVGREPGPVPTAKTPMNPVAPSKRGYPYCRTGGFQSLGWPSRTSYVALQNADHPSGRST